MFVELVVPQNIFFDAKSGNIRIFLRTFLKSLSRNPQKKGNDQIGNNIQFCQKVYENVNNVETL